jgi:hypothetical protein
MTPYLFSILSFLLNHISHSVVNMNYEKDLDNSTVPYAYQTTGNLPATLRDPNELLVLIPLTEQKNTEIPSSSAKRRKWSTFMASSGRTWDKAVDSGAIWPRFVYGMVALVLTVVWISIT